MAKHKRTIPDRKLKLLVVGQLPPPYHGSNVMAQTLLEALENLGHNILFVDKSFSKDIRTVGKFSFRKLFRIPILAFLLVRAVIAHRAYLCIYFISLAKGALLVDALLLWISRIIHLPYVLYFHGKGFKQLGDNSRLWHFVIERTLCKSLGGVVLGEALKDDVSPYISRDRFEIVPNGIESNSPLRSVESDTVNVLFLSNLIPSKGPLEFLKAAKIVLETIEDVRFVLGGAKQDEDFHNQLKSYISQNGLESFVDMPSGVYGEDKEALFASSHVFLFPTYYEFEAHPLVNLEAMSAGLPVISSSEGAIPEIVQDGITGFIVNPKDPEEIADRILRLVRDPELRERMGRAGRARFEKEYTFEAYVAHWERALQFFEGLLISSQTNHS